MPLKVLFLLFLPSLLTTEILDILSVVALFMPIEQIDLAGSLAIIDHIQAVIEFCLLT